MKELIFRQTTEQVARALISSQCYGISPNVTDESTYLTWKSGIRAPVYTDCRILPKHPGPRGVVLQALVSSIRYNFACVECIVGLESAGIIWGSLVAQDMGLPFAYVRKQEKTHGKGGRVECSPERNLSVLLVDDLVASGASLEDATRVLSDEKNINVIGIQSIVNWNFAEMRDRFQRLDIAPKALVSYPHLLREAVNQGLITDTVRAELELFYKNPRQHVWDWSAVQEERIIERGTWTAA